MSDRVRVSEFFIANMDRFLMVMAAADRGIVSAARADAFKASLLARADQSDRIMAEAVAAFPASSWLTPQVVSVAALGDRPVRSIRENES